MLELIALILITCITIVEIIIIKTKMDRLLALLYLFSCILGAANIILLVKVVLYLFKVFNNQAANDETLLLNLVGLIISFTGTQINRIYLSHKEKQY